jgi:hypothetical protein
MKISDEYSGVIASRDLSEWEDSTEEVSEMQR